VEYLRYVLELEVALDQRTNCCFQLWYLWYHHRKGEEMGHDAVQEHTEVEYYHA